MKAVASTRCGLARLSMRRGLLSPGSSGEAGIRPSGWRETASTFRKYQPPPNRKLIRVNRDDRRVALKVLSAHALREIEPGWLRERYLLRRATIYHLFITDSNTSSVSRTSSDSKVPPASTFASSRTCSATAFQVCKPSSPTHDFPSKLRLRLTKHVLKGLESLHDEYKVIHSGTSHAPSAAAAGRSNYQTDLKPGNILLLLSNTNTVVLRELSEKPATLYGFPKTTPPDALPFHPVQLTPLAFSLYTGQDTGMYWAIADLGYRG